MSTTADVPLWKRLFGITAFAGIAVLTLVVLTLAVIAFNGRREWAKTKADLLARGEKLSFVELAPPPIPDEQNFFADPLWREVLETESFTGSDGKIAIRPKVPYQKQKLLQGLRPPLSDALRDRAKNLSEAFGTNLGWDAKVFSITQSSAALHRASNQADRQLLAQFVVDALQPVGPVVAQVTDLLPRPGARAAIDYSLGPVAPIPHVNNLLLIGQILNARALAALNLGNLESSKADILSLLRLADTVQTEPLVISLLVRNSLISMATTTIADGIRNHLWTDGQLAEFDSQLGGINLLPQLALALRGERGSFNQFVELMHRSPARAREIIRHNTSNGNPLPESLPDRARYEIGSRVFTSSDQSAYNRTVQKWVDAVDHSSRHGIHPEDFPSQRIDEDWRPPFHPLLALFSSPSFSYVAQTCYVQDQIAQTRIACALERYRLRHSTYPVSLEALVPDFLAALPAAVLAGQKIRYQPEGDGTFRLWTAGWDQLDESGTLEAGQKGKRHRENGDWVWGVPSPPLTRKAATLAPAP